MLDMLAHTSPAFLFPSLLFALFWWSASRRSLDVFRWLLLSLGAWLSAAVLLIVWRLTPTVTLLDDQMVLSIAIAQTLLGLILGWNGWSARRTPPLARS